MLIPLTLAWPDVSEGTSPAALYFEVGNSSPKKKKATESQKRHRVELSSRWAPTFGVLTFACPSSRASCWEPGSPVFKRREFFSLLYVMIFYKAEVPVERCHLPLLDAYF